ncbi:ATP-binding protein [Actinoplanes sp. NPDC026619]|uniref:sensor histidine kinase n=1 Tax=Actinoplanes sp. NPDC026619 TaxID=3155798 RepID=UPI0033E4938E
MTEAQELAQRIHDGVLQSLAVARIRLDRALATGGPLAHDVGEDLRALLDREIAALRDLVRGAGPARAGVGATLTETAHRLESLTGISVSVDERATADPTTGRVLHEALHNAIRHSGATHVRVIVAGVGKHLVGQVRDNGRGFDPGAARRGLGITAMYARTKAAGGELEIDSTGAGTVVTVTLPRSAGR